MPNSRCIRVVTPDDHVNIGFHEVLIHDLADEELPLVTLSELGCLPWTGRRPCLHLCLDINLIWTRCGKNVGSGLVPHSLELVRPVVNIYSRIWANISPYTTWSWRSCGDARCHGVRFVSGPLVPATDSD